MSIYHPRIQHVGVIYLKFDNAECGNIYGEIEVVFNLIRAVWVVGLSLLCFSFAGAASPPTNFNQAKTLLKNHVYYDQNKGGTLGTLYCGCDWDWVGRSGGRVDHNSCGYKVRAQETRAARTEWEHIVVASSLGRQLQCWQNGGRKSCQATSPQFNEMEANLFNLSPAVGEVNGDRSNYNMGIVSPTMNGMYGRCKSKTDFKNRTFEPRDEAKGFVARTYFYMYDRYPNLRMSEQQQKLFMAWDKQLGDETLNKNPAKKAAVLAVYNEIIHGNRNSKIYHLSVCPSYNAMKDSNKVEFKTEEDALKAGYRKAKNCP